MKFILWLGIQFNWDMRQPRYASCGRVANAVEILWQRSPACESSFFQAARSSVIGTMG
jgi:hypothetical protein